MHEQQDKKIAAETVRVRLEYEFISSSGTRSRELPFVIGVLGDFSADSDRRLPWEVRACLSINSDTFDAVLNAVHPRIRMDLRIPFHPSPLEVDLSFGQMDDFQPARIVERVKQFQRLHRSGSPDDRAVLQLYLDTLFHSPGFRRLEAAWTGLWHLVSRVGASSLVEIRLIDVTMEELLDDLGSGNDVEQSTLYEKVHREPYETPGSDPFSLFIGDFSFTPAQADMELLSGIAAVAHKCMAPFLAAAGPEMLNVNSFDWIAEDKNIFRTRSRSRLKPWNAGDPLPKYDDFYVPVKSDSWDSLRSSEDARFVGLVLPRVLLRQPHGLRAQEANAFTYRESTEGDRYMLWGNAAFALGAGIAESFLKDGWFGSFQWGQLDLAAGLPRRDWKRPFVNDLISTSVEVQIAENSDRRLAELGFIPIDNHYLGGIAGVSQTQTCQKPKIHTHLPELSDQVRINARLFCNLAYVLAAARFLLYMKVIVRDGPNHTRENWERILNKWIAQYCRPGSAPEDAQHPLCGGSPVHVSEVPQNPGHYKITGFLLPRYKKLCGLTADIRLATSAFNIAPSRNSP